MTKHMQDNDIVIPAPYPSEEDLFLFVDQNKIETLFAASCIQNAAKTKVFTEHPHLQDAPVILYYTDLSETVSWGKPVTARTNTADIFKREAVV